jgi:hypothetical protein
MALPPNGWSPVRSNWTGAYGMWWTRVRAVAPPPPVFVPGTWKPKIDGKDWSGIGAPTSAPRGSAPGARQGLIRDRRGSQALLMSQSS